MLQNVDKRKGSEYSPIASKCDRSFIWFAIPNIIFLHFKKDSPGFGRAMNNYLEISQLTYLIRVNFL